jgi:hypothetical protein
MQRILRRFEVQGQTEAREIEDGIGPTGMAQADVIDGEIADGQAPQQPGDGE